MTITTLVAIHMTAALAAPAVGPLALWARRAGRQRPRLHRVLRYAWMLATAVSALFIRDTILPNVAGFTQIHLLVALTLAGLAGSFWLLARGDVAAHWRTMQRLYVGACVVAGAFTLLPSRLLGRMVWVDWLVIAPLALSSIRPGT